MVTTPTPVYAEAQYRIRSKIDESLGHERFLAECPRRVLWGWRRVKGAEWRWTREKALADISRDRHRRIHPACSKTVEEIFDRDIPDWPVDPATIPPKPRP